MYLDDGGEYTRRYMHNYPLWAQEILGMDVTTDQQVVSNAFTEHNFVAAKSGTTCGKTTLLATKAIWFLTTRKESKVVCTAPTGHQLEDLLFAEMQAWIRRIKFEPLKNALRVISGKIYIEGYRDWYIVARTIPKDSKDKLGDVLAGFHAPWLCFLIDESAGVPDACFKGIEGSMIQKNVHCIMAGNPTRSNGFFFDAFNKNKMHWSRVTLSSERSPFTKSEYIQRIRNLHGEDSDFYRTKILGEFPKGGSSCIITTDELFDSFHRWKNTDPECVGGKLIAGLDPAGGRNDQSVLTFRKGLYVFPPVRIKHRDTDELEAKVAKLCVSRGSKELVVEYNGVGIGVYDGLRRRPGFKTYKYIPNGRANDPQGYKNLRAELFMQLKDNAQDLMLPPHDRYLEEFPEITILEDKEPFQIEEKSSIKSRLGFSTDYADSVAISTFRHFSTRFSDMTSDSLAAYASMNTNLHTESTFERI